MVHTAGSRTRGSLVGWRPTAGTLVVGRPTAGIGPQNAFAHTVRSLRIRPRRYASLGLMRVLLVLPLRSPPVARYNNTDKAYGGGRAGRGSWRLWGKGAPPFISQRAGGNRAGLCPCRIRRYAHQTANGFPLPRSQGPLPAWHPTGHLAVLPLFKRRRGALV